MKYNYIKTISLLSVFCLAQLLLPKIIFADYEKPANEKMMFVDKRVRSLEMDKYVDNLDAQTKKFKKGDLIEFTIYIENNGLTGLYNITIKDFLPKNLQLVLYDGTYNKADNTLEWKINELLPSQNRKYLIRALIKKDNQAGGIYTNTVRGTSDTAGDQDTSSYFVIGKAGVVATSSATKTIPQSGPSDLIVQTILSLTAIGGAIGIRKYARGY